MSQAEGLTDAGLRTPRAAAVAGVVFSSLTLISFGLLWGAIPADLQSSGGWLATNTAEIALALNLIPFAGIAFLWFIGVIRDRLGQREDRFFATVFLGSGLLFLGMLFIAAAVVGAMLARIMHRADGSGGSFGAIWVILVEFGRAGSAPALSLSFGWRRFAG